MPWIRLSDDGSRFVQGAEDRPFTPWGCNYDADAQGRLLEDYWVSEWETVVEDFQEMRALGINTVRVHLQLGKTMTAPDRADAEALRQIGRLLELAEESRLYLDLTGLGCYHKQDVPPWYDALGEAERWEVQARFWEAIAKTCAESPAVFCYDLMNEPVAPGAGKVEGGWLAGEPLGGKYFVQRISLDLAGRTRDEVVAAWVAKLSGAIRKHDTRHLVTVGVIPWAYAFYPNVKQPIFYSESARKHLDFVSVHFYPKKGEVEKALDALRVYDVGMPVVIEEMFPLSCGIEELDAFIRGSRATAEGWISFYWGKSAAEYRAEEPSFAGAIKAAWLEHFAKLTAEMMAEPASADEGPR